MRPYGLPDGKFLYWVNKREKQLNFHEAKKEKEIFALKNKLNEMEILLKKTLENSKNIEAQNIVYKKQNQNLKELMKIIRFENENLKKDIQILEKQIGGKK